jgi:diguanylate cyclase (GGDEF)-like protein
MSSQKRVVKSLFFYLSFLSLFLFSSETLSALNPEQKMNRFTVDCIDSGEGLPQNTVQDIIQNKTGFMLFATQEGIAQFDGIKFEVITRKDHPFLNSDNISAIKHSYNETIVAGTTSGISFFENGKTVFDGIFIKDFFIEKDGTVWAATLNSGIIKLSPSGEENRYNRENGKLNSNTTLSITQDTEGSIFVATTDGVSIMKDDKFIPLENLYAYVNQLESDKDGVVWAATNRGLALIKNGKVDYLYVKEDGLPTESLRSVRKDSQGAVWIGDENGRIIRFYKGNFSLLPENDKFHTGAVISLFEDREKNIWFGTEATGTCIIKEGSVFQAGINRGNIRSITETSDGLIWTATFGEGIKILDKEGRVSVLDTSQGLRSNSISSIFADSKGRVWIGSRRDGVQIFNQGKLVDLDNLTQGFVFAQPVSPTLFFEDSRGNVWITDRHSTKPVFKWAEGEIKSYSIIEEETSILDIAEDQKGLIYLASLKNGIFVYDENTDKFTPVEMPGRYGITSLYIDHKNRIWLSTLSDGLIVIVEGDFVFLNEGNGLYSNSVHDIVQDEKGYYWFSTNKGIFTVSGDNFEKFISGVTESISFKLFKEEDGMPAGECNGGSQPSILKASDGTLWFPTIRGAVTVDPKKLEISTEIPPITITGVFIDNHKTKKITDSGNFILPAGTRSAEFKFTSLYFSQPNKIQFEYMLEGFDIDWNKTPSRSAVYTNIDPGDYKFKVKSYLSDSPEDFSMTSIGVTYKPLFYQNPVYRLIALSFLLLMIVGFIRLKTYLHKRRELDMQEIIDVRTEQLRATNEQLRASVLKDPMTGLCNRRYLFEIEQHRYERKLYAIRQEIIEKGEDVIPNEGKVTGLFLIDITGLKSINEQRGYEFGDKLLQEFAKMLKESVRKDDLIVRWGGDEFLSILNATDSEHLPIYARKIIDIAKKGIVVDDLTIPLSLSIGFSSMPFYKGEKNLNFEENLLMSDMALYRAITAGKNKIMQAVPGNAVPTKEEIEVFMKNIDKGIVEGFFNIIEV